uniref:Uncharacterized protein n=1 Tax=Candidatus Kentrum sp. UNK TaxID=2126344 RepID=A0A450ZWN5_9GAMM|nr:MAG: hypothetical protein BECKUNK1418G_GA0071005_100231 [Candidatus Kentron sp. UNK]VFK68292.1 MAG: hypothetical protein BECKUNK1418H_GA0071006_100131 [Candidatus Kentron sp. UNK]
MHWLLEHNIASNRSPYTKSSETQEWPGARWIVTMTFTNMTRREGQSLSAFINSLRGPSGKFRLFHFECPTPLGTVTGTPRIKGAEQTGDSILVDGLPSNTTGVFELGDFIGIGDEIKQITARVDSDENGEANIAITPNIRITPSDDALVVYGSSTAIFSLKDNQQGAFGFETSVADVEIQIEEAF